jgi:hypothetical protein
MVCIGRMPSLGANIIGAPVIATIEIGMGRYDVATIRVRQHWNFLVVRRAIHLKVSNL